MTSLDSRTFTMSWGDPWPRHVAAQLSLSFAPLLPLAGHGMGEDVRSVS